MALDEFLVKNDPCRAKGRTNVGLREHFTLAEGVSQSMAHFKSRPLGGAARQGGGGGGSATSGSSASYSSGSATGPITKIREKTLHSAPWRQQKSKISSDSEVRQILTPKAGGLLQKTTTRTHGHVHAHEHGTGSPCFEGGTASGHGGSSRGSSRGGSRPPSVVESDGSELGDTTDSKNAAAAAAAAGRSTPTTHQTIRPSQAPRTAASTPKAAATTATKLPKPSTPTLTRKMATTSSATATTTTSTARPKKPQTGFR